jgi:hypothetical protein
LQQSKISTFGLNENLCHHFPMFSITTSIRTTVNNGNGELRLETLHPFLQPAFSPH